MIGVIECAIKPAITIKIYEGYVALEWHFSVELSSASIFILAKTCGKFYLKRLKETK
jgi:hypothetical protein